MAVYLVSFISFRRHLFGRLLNQAIQISVGGKCLILIPSHPNKFASHIPMLVYTYFVTLISSVNHWNQCVFINFETSAGT